MDQEETLILKGSIGSMFVKALDFCLLRDHWVESYQMHFISFYSFSLQFLVSIGYISTIFLSGYFQRPNAKHKLKFKWLKQNSLKGGRVVIFFWSVLAQLILLERGSSQQQQRLRWCADNTKQSFHQNLSILITNNSYSLKIIMFSNFNLSLHIVIGLSKGSFNNFVGILYLFHYLNLRNFIGNCEKTPNKKLLKLVCFKQWMRLKKSSKRGS